MGVPNFTNRTLYHGDNLDFLRGMDSGTVTLIATDPPFNKSKDFYATPDSLAAGAQFQDRWSWQDDIHDDWLIPIQRDEPEVWQVINAAKQVYGDDMGAFLCWLGVRLLEMHRILADNGSLYLHIDHTAHAWVKCLLDAIFGRENFRNEIAWCYFGPSNVRRNFPRKHDTILFYSKGDSYVFNRESVRVPYKILVGTPGGIIGDQHSESRVRELRKKGKIVEDYWTDIFPVVNQKEKTGYPTQKPLALYERIIRASSNPGDFVVDPFCGCATTPIAAERLGRQWVGMDIWNGAVDLVRKRLEDNKQLLTDADPQILYRTEPPTRTDDGEPAALVLRTPMGRVRQRFPAPRTQHGKLVTDIGALCQGCGADYAFDSRVLEVDHIRPKSDGGSDAYDNLTLLCPPCNKEKRDYYTLTYLQMRNRENGYMKNETNLRMGRASGPAPRRRGKRR